jgi:hypothetical protein
MSNAERDVTGFMNELDKSIASLTAALEDGGLTDFAQYKFLVGQIRGVKHAKLLIEEYIQKMEKDNG